MKLRFFFLAFVLVVLSFLLFGISRLNVSDKLLPFLKNVLFIENPVKNNTCEVNSHLESLIKQRLENLEVAENDIKRHFFLEDSTLEIDALVPKGKPLEWIIWYLTTNIKHTGYNVYDSYCESDNKACHIKFVNKNSKKSFLQLNIKRSTQYFSQSAKIAFLVEDFGFEANQTTIEYLSFPEPLTVSLVPSRKMTTWTAQIANEYHKEIVILLPMEPVPRSLKKYRNSTLKVHYPQGQLKEFLLNSMESIPNFAGYSNLYGNQFLADSRVTKQVLFELKKHNGYFIYSPTSRKSVASAIAKELDLPFRTVDVTVNSKSISSIADTLRHFAITAQKTGSFIIKTSPTIEFITALKRDLPIFKQNGVRLVYVSDVIRSIQKN